MDVTALVAGIVLVVASFVVAASVTRERRTFEWQRQVVWYLLVLLGLLVGVIALVEAVRSNGRVSGFLSLLFALVFCFISSSARSPVVARSTVAFVRRPGVIRRTTRKGAGRPGGRAAAG